MKVRLNKGRLINLIFFLLIAASMFSQQILLQNHIRETEVIIPYDSFVKIETNIRYSELKDDVVETSGSGVLIGYTQNDRALILTVNHMCNLPFESLIYADTSPSLSNYKEIWIIDAQGGVHSATAIFNSIEYDLCILETGYFPGIPVRIAETAPIPGTKYYNVAAPGGFFEPGMAPIFDGYYSGDVNYRGDNDSIFTIPARGGSSGSPVTNNHGEIVSIIHSALAEGEHISVGCTWFELTDFINTYETLFNETLP